MRSTTLGLILANVSLALSACTVTGQPGPQTSPVGLTETTKPAETIRTTEAIRTAETNAPPTSPARRTPQQTGPEPGPSPRGLIPKSIGENARYAEPNGPAQLNFSVDAIAVDPVCTASSPLPAEHGHLVALWMTVQTTRYFDPQTLFRVNTAEFDVVGPDERTESEVDTMAGFSCLAATDRLPSDTYAPASIYIGAVVLDTRYTSGTITYRPTVLMDGGGWEFTF